MPIYEYVCRTCARRFDRLRPVSERLDPPPCPACGTAATSLVMSATARVGVAAGGMATAAAEACGGGDGSCCGGACLN